MSDKRIPLHDHADNNSGGKLHPPSIVQAVLGPVPTSTGAVGTGIGTVAVQENSSAIASVGTLNLGHGLDGSDQGGGAVGIAVDESEFTYGATGDMTAEAIGSTVSAGASGKPSDAGHRHAMPSAAAPSGGYGTAAAGSAATLLRSDAVLAKPTAADVDFSADVTTNNASTTAHGLLPKLDGNPAHFLDGTGALSTPSGSGALNHGTSNPGSPASGDTYFRTDLGLLIYYDGAQWLCICEHNYPLVLATALLPFSATTGTSNVSAQPGVARGFSIYITKSLASFFVAGGTALSGSHKWVGVVNDDVTGNFATHTVASGASSVWRTDTQTLTKTLTTSSLHLETTWTKTGTPGNLYVSVVLFYRYIVT